MAKVLVTGCAGFIGMHTAARLLRDGHKVIGIDNLNDYYDPQLKLARLSELGIKNEPAENEPIEGNPNFTFIKLDIQDQEQLLGLFKESQFDYVVHLAAQAGVRYSVINPNAYMGNNVNGFFNILEACRQYPIKHLVYASSSSVYGLNENIPFSVEDNVDHPISLYAASKKSNELMAHAYSHLYKIPTTGLRFFVVYGPWGRPDMAIFLFTKAILNGETINVYNHGDMKRDFTYVGDITEGISRVVVKPAQVNGSWDGSNPDPSSSVAPYKVYNIGNSNPVPLMDFINAIEEKLGKKAEINYMPIQPGDVPITYADVDALKEDFGYSPSYNLKQGVEDFVDWYKSFYKVD